jgi:hypothetical protein
MTTVFLLVSALATINGPACRTGAHDITTLNGVVVRPVCDNVYVEAPYASAQADAVVDAVNAAYAHLFHAFVADTSFRAAVIVCRTASCKIALGASESVASSADLGFAATTLTAASGIDARRAVVVTGPNSATTRVLTHELVHALMKSWVAYDALPVWFNEGLATAIADEPPCGAFAPTSEIDVTKLVSTGDWQAQVATAGATLRTYCQARHATEAWSSFADAPELAAKARDLAQRVRNGAAFR